MPKISEFFGIVILMYFRDHNPPHFHAEYGEDEVLLDIRTLGIIRGRLPPRQLGRVVEWAALHQTELLGAWERARGGTPVDAIEPLG